MQTYNVKSQDLWRLRELQRKIRNKYPYISQVQVERQAWIAFINERKNGTEKKSTNL